MLSRKYQPSRIVKLGVSQIYTKNQMNIFGVLCDRKLQCSAQVANAISKAKKALHGIKLIKPYVNNQELKQVITSNLYSILYYDSEIRHIPILNQYSEHQMLAVSASALKLCTTSDVSYISYSNFINKYLVQNCG